MENLIVIKEGGKTHSSSNFDFKERILSDTSKLTLFLILKEEYSKNYQGVSQEYSDIFNYKIISDKKNLKLLQQLIVKQTSLYPRISQSLTLLLNEFENESKASDKLKLLNQFYKLVFEDFLFSEEIYKDFKGNTKVKFLHIGLKYW